MRQILEKAFGRLAGFRAGKSLMVAVILVGFLAGYNTTSSYINSCNAQIAFVPSPPVLGGVCFKSCCSSCKKVPCDPAGTASVLGIMLSTALKLNLVAASIAIENFFAFTVDTMVMAILDRINVMEQDWISWWQTMWIYNLKPAMQSMTRQLNVATTDQSRTFQGAIDSVEESQTSTEYQETEYEAHRDFRVAEQVCVAGTNAGGMGRASEFSKGIRKALQRQSRERGLNLKGTPAANGVAASETLRHEEYDVLFCDPNGGVNPCAGDPAYYNADTEVTRRIYNDLTINIDDDPKIQRTVDALMDNMTGSSSAEQIQLKAMETATGREKFLQRRSFLARHAAVRSVPQLLIGWRTPGSNMGTWIKQLRNDAGIPDSHISDNPSYREIVHAMSVDRFNSGKYANQMITDQATIEMEKLLLSSFYLMQLRDYYELLERQALALSVQVAIMADAVPMPDINLVRPVR